ncbi:hypothetical protein M3D57_09615 [Corynebacterium sanguinis]|uniref:hypothetical protein n=1 Tax=Corynebacterium sanguinis TaxID=2594913 RepID=UPI00223BC638|nr:hypothetical protein [Corynebacterium sanguinis]MCT1584663.1 hypothetical protein [Corynebacterium sanguinis]MCT2047748.1 hypothetical protein [Corynebacterium sanguinis]
MATEPITHFSDRAAAVSAALRMTGVVPKAAEAMARADEKINGVMDMFDARTAARDLSEFTEAGRTWAKNPTRGGLDRLVETLDAPIGNAVTTVPIRVEDGWGGHWEYPEASTPHTRRLAAARKGALDGLIAKYDKPDYSTATLIESCKAEVRAWFDNLAPEYTEALAALDDEARDKAAATGRGDAVLDLIDPATTPEATIAAYRRFARAWRIVDDSSAEHADLARAMAFNDVSDTPNEGRDVFARMEELASHRARFHALMFDAEACALDVFDMNPVKAVAAGLGRVAPLADPLGDDLPELEHRLEAINAAVAWLDYRKRTVGDRHRGAKGLYSAHDRYGEPTAAASLAAFKADRPEVFHTEAADYDLDPAADIYAE